MCVFCNDFVKERYRDTHFAFSVLLPTMYFMKVRTKSERDEILTEIFQLYPTKLIELDYETPFQLLTAVMLSAQMTDT